MMKKYNFMISIMVACVFTNMVAMVQDSVADTCPFGTARRSCLGDLVKNEPFQSIIWSFARKITPIEELAQNMRGLKFLDATNQKIKIAGQEITVAIQLSPEHDLIFHEQIVDPKNLAELLLKTNITFNLRESGILFELKPKSTPEDGLKLLEIIGKMGKYVPQNDKTMQDLEEFIASQKIALEATGITNTEVREQLSAFAPIKCGNECLFINNRSTRIAKYNNDQQIWSISTTKKPNPGIMLYLLENVLPEILQTLDSRTK